VRPEGRLRIGTALATMSRKIGLTNTGVVSEAMKPEPHRSVRGWLDTQAAETLFLSSVTIAGLMFGIGSRASTAYRSCSTRGSRWSHHDGHITIAPAGAGVCNPSMSSTEPPLNQ
jgi:hypothetical protein